MNTQCSQVEISFFYQYNILLAIILLFRTSRSNFRRKLPLFLVLALALLIIPQFNNSFLTQFSGHRLNKPVFSVLILMAEGMGMAAWGGGGGKGESPQGVVRFAALRWRQNQLEGLTKNRGIYFPRNSLFPSP